MSLRAARPLLRAARSLRTPLAPRIAIATLKPCTSIATRNFASSSRRLGSGESDATLSASISAEQKYEAESAVTLPSVPEFLAAFNENGTWELRDIPGNDDVELVRTFGNETLKLTFQVSDLDLPEDASAAAATEEVEEASGEDGAAVSSYITCSLVLSKSKHPNAVSVDLEAGEGGFEITNVAVFEKTVGEAKGAEGDWIRRGKYMGPQFDTLDSGVQDAFAAYLAERGIDDSLAQFIISYCEYKEQKDYVSWLGQIQGFVDH